MTEQQTTSSVKADLIFMPIMGVLYWIWMVFLAWRTNSPLNPLYGITGAPNVGTAIALLWVVAGFVLVTVSDGRKLLREKFDSTGKRITVVLTYLLVGWLIDYLPYALSNGFSWKIIYFLIFMVLPGVLVVIPWNDDDLTANIVRFVLVLIAWAGHDAKIYQYSFAPDGYFNAINALQTVFITLIAFAVYRNPFDETFARFDITLNDLKYGLLSLFILFAILTPTGLYLKFLTLNPSKNPLLYLGIFVEIFVRVAIIEELIFRDILQRAADNYFNVAESKLRSIGSLILVSLFFGLFHANNLADLTNTIIYVVFAFIAGIFYAIAWRFERRLLAAVITHVGVDLLWFTVFYAGTGA